MPGRKQASGSKLSPVQIVGLVLAIVVVSVGVALTYFYFEAAVRNSVNYVWDTWLKTDNRRLLVVPTSLVLGLIFFGVQHFIDPASETHDSKGLGSAPSPTIRNFVNVLGIGFLSLLAGASLGPEAILVPACVILGGYVGATCFKRNALAPKLLGMVGIVALLAAFFHSFIAGMLGLLLVTKQVHIKLNIMMVVVAALSSGVTVYILSLLESQAYVKLPPTQWNISFESALVLIALILGGFLATYILHGLFKLMALMRQWLNDRPWWVRWLVASIGLSALYLLGGTLVEFTGNESILPMLHQSATLGVVGLLWILVIKLAVISWSKNVSYRGGLVFPTIFVASVVVAITQHFDPHVSFIFGLVAVMAGILVADRKSKILL